MTAAQKRQVVRELRQQGLCLRLGLKLVQMARATFYRQGRGRPEEQRLQERIRELALSQASFGYRRITAVLRRQGLRVNPKRVYRLYRQLDLQKPVRKKGRRGLKRPVSFAPSEALFAGQVRAVDFIEDKLVSGRRLRILNVLDICSRYGLGSRVEHSITGARWRPATWRGCFSAMVRPGFSGGIKGPPIFLVPGRQDRRETKSKIFTSGVCGKPPLPRRSPPAGFGPPAARGSIEFKNAAPITALGCWEYFPL